MRGPPYVIVNMGPTFKKLNMGPHFVIVYVKPAFRSCIWDPLELQHEIHLWNQNIESTFRILSMGANF